RLSTVTSNTTSLSLVTTVVSVRGALCVPAGSVTQLLVVSSASILLVSVLWQPTAMGLMWTVTESLVIEFGGMATWVISEALVANTVTTSVKSSQILTFLTSHIAISPGCIVLGNLPAHCVANSANLLVT